MSDQILPQNTKNSKHNPPKFEPFAFFLSSSTAIYSLGAGLTTDTLLIGQGFNSSTGIQGGQSVAYNGSDDLSSALATSGQELEYKVESIISVQEFSSILGISAAAKVGLGMFSGSVTANYLRSNNVSSLNSYLCVSVRVTNASEVLKRSVLSEPAKDRYKRSGPEGFAQFAGDSYVYGRKTGGELMAIIEFTSSNSNQYSDTRTKVQAAAKRFGSGEVTFEQTLTSVSQLETTNITLIRNGSHGQVGSFSKLIEAANSFPVEVEHDQYPVIIEFLTRGYSSVEDADQYPVNSGIFIRQCENISKLALVAEDLYAAQGMLNTVLRNATAFQEIQPSSSGTSLAERASTCFSANRLAISKIEILAQYAAVDPAYELPALPSVQNIPVVYVEKVETPPPAPPVVELFADAGFAGRAFSSSDSIPNLVDSGFNDITSSIRVNGKPGEYEVEFFEDSGYSGQSFFKVYSPCVIVNLADHFFVKIGWGPILFPRRFTMNDKLSSFRIRRL